MEDVWSTGLLSDSQGSSVDCSVVNGRFFTPNLCSYLYVLIDRHTNDYVYDICVCVLFSGASDETQDALC